MPWVIPNESIPQKLIIKIFKTHIITRQRQMAKSMMINWWNCSFLLLLFPNDHSQGNDTLNDKVIVDFRPTCKRQKTFFQVIWVLWVWMLYSRCYECAADGCVTEEDLGVEKLCKAEAQVCFVGVGECWQGFENNLWKGLNYLWFWEWTGKLGMRAKASLLSDIFFFYVWLLTFKQW